MKNFKNKVAAITGAGSGIGQQLALLFSAGQDGSQDAIVARRFGNDGVARSGEFVVNTTTAGWQVAPDVAGRADGGFVVSWQSLGQDGSLLGVVSKNLQPNATPGSLELLTNTYTVSDQGDSATAALANGRAVVVWSSHGQDGSGDGVFAQLISPAGERIGSEFRINVESSSFQSQPDVTTLADGGFAVVWASYGPGR